MGSIAGLIGQLQAQKHSQAAASGPAAHALPASARTASPLAGAATGASAASTTSSSSSADISTNDFLTLLVTEMQNQDPTADTDPNEYINQLVEVNSLEQLISINQNLSTVLGTSPTTGGATPGTGSVANSTGVFASGKTAAHSSPAGSAAAVPSAATRNSGPAAALSRFAQSATAKSAAAPSSVALSSARRSSGGNLGIPAASPASQRVAHALDGHPHTQPGAALSPPGH